MVKVHVVIVKVIVVVVKVVSTCSSSSCGSKIVLVIEVHVIE